MEREGDGRRLAERVTRETVARKSARSVSQTTKITTRNNFNISDSHTNTNPTKDSDFGAQIRGFELKRGKEVFRFVFCFVLFCLFVFGLKEKEWEMEGELLGGRVPSREPSASWWLTDAPFQSGIFGGASENLGKTGEIDTPETDEDVGEERERVIVIVGGGMSGISMAYWLLTLSAETESAPKNEEAKEAAAEGGDDSWNGERTLRERIRVIVLESRGVSSCATGRNGGHMWPYSPSESHLDALSAPDIRTLSRVFLSWQNRIHSFLRNRPEWREKCLFERTGGMEIVESEEEAEDLREYVEKVHSLNVKPDLAFWDKEKIAQSPLNTHKHEIAGAIFEPGNDECISNDAKYLNISSMAVLPVFFFVFRGSVLASNVDTQCFIILYCRESLGEAMFMCYSWRYIVFCFFSPLNFTHVRQ